MTGWCGVALGGAPGVIPDPKAQERRERPREGIAAGGDTPAHDRYPRGIGYGTPRRVHRRPHHPGETGVIVVQPYPDVAGTGDVGPGPDRDVGVGALLSKSHIVARLFQAGLRLQGKLPYRLPLARRPPVVANVKPGGGVYLASRVTGVPLSLIHISEPTRLGMISYAVFCLKKKKR